MKEVYIKTGGVIVGSIVITLLLTTFIFENNTPQVKPGLTKITVRITNILLGSEGKPVTVGVDPTPPPTIYN
jgi:hypothetical protein